MGASGGFPIDLVLFGMIAAFLVLRLRSILGRRTGFERPPQRVQPPPGAARPAEGPVIDGVAEPARRRPRAAARSGQRRSARRWRACSGWIAASIRRASWTAPRRRSA